MSDETASVRTTSTVKFLIVDDDMVSVMAMKRALKKLKIVNPVQVAKDGQQALEILRGEKNGAEFTPPFLVTLDLNMPRMNGFEFLEEIRKDSSLQRAVIFVLSTSDAPRDVAAAYANNIAGYIIKDNLGDSFVKALDMIDAYSKIVELPQ
ncbi:MAG: response regulator [Amylibacter sp.]|jgi:CheY-like chemotaxis protein|nr:response regulator [Amylibacter sp.]